MPEWVEAASVDPEAFGQIVVRAVASVSGADGFNLEDLLVTQFRLLEWVRRSHHQQVVLAVFAKRARQNWSTNLAARRAMLPMPALTVHAVEPQLASGSEDAAFIARVAWSAERAVSVGLAGAVTLACEEDERRGNSESPVDGGETNRNSAMSRLGREGGGEVRNTEETG